MASAIGIDLGTVYSCVGVYQYGNIDILANVQGNRITPSVVAFTEVDRLVGDAAKNQITLNPENTIYDAKRLIGHRYSEISDDDKSRWPFEVIDDGDKPMYEVIHKNQTERYSPEQISAAILNKLKKTAEHFLNEEVTNAVITVPAHFSDSQRQATKDAAEIAGLKVLQLLSEPTAAAVAYGLNKKLQNDQNILVFDMGGGTFDVSILTIDDDVYQVRAVGGDMHLGGEDFNNRMFDHFVKEIDDQHNVDITSDVGAKSRLLRECEIAKIALSTSSVANVKVDALYNGTDFHSSITRARFEELNDDFFDKAIEIVEQTIKDAKLTKAEIEEVVLVGGSTYIPKVQKMLQDCFGGKKLNKSIKPDEAVAYGAAVYASVLNGDDSNDFELVLLDVTPRPLGTNIQGGKMNVIIDKNTPIPFEKTTLYTTIVDNQSKLEIGVYEGENEDVADNNLLGSFELRGIPPAKARVPCIRVTMQVNADGILKVHAINPTNDEENSITIQEYKDRLSQEEINDNRTLEANM